MKMLNEDISVHLPLKIDIIAGGVVTFYLFNFHPSGKNKLKMCVSKPENQAHLYVLQYLCSPRVNARKMLVPPSNVF